MIFEKERALTATKKSRFIGDLLVAVLSVVPAFLLGKLVVHLNHGPMPLPYAIIAAAIGIAVFCFVWGRQPIWLPRRPLVVLAGSLVTFGGMLLLTR